jgi:hypothetical protein
MFSAFVVKLWHLGDVIFKNKSGMNNKVRYESLVGESLSHLVFFFFLVLQCSCAIYLFYG